MRLITSGVTRVVILAGPVAVKVPRGGPMGWVRGWLANRSEWHQRYRPDVTQPIATLAHLVTVYPRADATAPPSDQWSRTMQTVGYSAEEAKPSSWGRFGTRWRLIDFDRAWQHPRGWVGGAYYWNQERLGRKWANLA